MPLAVWEFVFFALCLAHFLLLSSLHVNNSHVLLLDAIL